uniref:Uncharacterized protein n=1 Tax=Junco hyemalis TaxID=40217 RepID=A0A8C5JGL8_JUNHY
MFSSRAPEGRWLQPCRSAALSPRTESWPGVVVHPGLEGQTRGVGRALGQESPQAVPEHSSGSWVWGEASPCPVVTWTCQDWGAHQALPCAPGTSGTPRSHSLLCCSCRSISAWNHCWDRGVWAMYSRKISLSSPLGNIFIPPGSCPVNNRGT